MNKAQWHLDFNPNVGIIDRFARYILSVTLIGIALIAEQVPVGWVVILPLIAIPIFISAFSAWDPIYALFQKAPAPIYSYFMKKTSK
jgi:hypothetical protein